MTLVYVLYCFSIKMQNVGSSGNLIEIFKNKTTCEKMMQDYCGKDVDVKCEQKYVREG